MSEPFAKKPTVEVLEIYPDFWFKGNKEVDERGFVQISIPELGLEINNISYYVDAQHHVSVSMPKRNHQKEDRSTPVNRVHPLEGLKTAKREKNKGQ